MLFACFCIVAGTVIVAMFFYCLFKSFRSVWWRELAFYHPLGIDMSKRNAIITRILLLTIGSIAMIYGYRYFYLEIKATSDAIKECQEAIKELQQMPSHSSNSLLYELDA